MIVKTALGLSAAALLAGCALTPEDTAVSSTGSSLIPLIEAPDRMTATCSTVEPLSVTRPVSTLVFRCDSLNVTATLPEIKDAGWRVEAVDIGAETAENGGGSVPGMPLTITVKKLF